LPANERDQVVYANPTSMEERSALAESCVRKLKIDVPAVVDGIDNATEAAYTGWPDRLYVIDKEGRVRHKAAPGPYGFRPAQVEAALKRLGV